jgi:hypothetical protein
MRWVAHAADRPHRCAAIPFIGNSNAKRGFVDTGQRLPGWDPHVYVSLEAVEEMARMIGWQPAHIDQRQRDHVKALEAKVARAEAENEQLTERLNAVRVLKNRNGRFEQVNPPGRPRKVA